MRPASQALEKKTLIPGCLLNRFKKDRDKAKKTLVTAQVKLKVKKLGRSYNYAFHMKPAEILLPSKQRRHIQARSLLYFWAVKELGLSATSVAQKLGMTQPSISRSVQRGERLAVDEQLEFELNTQNA